MVAASALIVYGASLTIAFRTGVWQTRGVQISTGVTSLSKSPLQKGATIFTRAGSLIARLYMLMRASQPWLPRELSRQVRRGR